MVDFLTGLRKDSTESASGIGVISNALLSQTMASRSPAPSGFPATVGKESTHPVSVLMFRYSGLKASAYCFLKVLNSVFLSMMMEADSALVLYADSL